VVGLVAALLLRRLTARRGDSGDSASQSDGGDGGGSSLGRRVVMLATSVAVSALVKRLLRKRSADQAR